jgi:hypothetical protein
VTTALIESALLCSAGAAIGWLGYTWIRDLFINAMPRGLQSFAAETADARLIAMTWGSALVSAVVAGTLPAVRTSRVNPLDAFRPTRGSTIDRLVGGPVLLAVQATFGMLLLAGALAVVPGVVGFLLRFPGFEPVDLFVFHVPTSSGPDATDAMEQTRRGLAVMEVARRLPGVASVALSDSDPFTTVGRDLLPSNRMAPPGFAGRVLAVGEEFFDTLAVPIIAGRRFSNDDIDRQDLVAIVDESGVRALWPDLPAASAIGRTVTTSDGPRVVVGVTADMRIGIDDHRHPSLFLPLSAADVYRQADNNPYFHNSFRVILRMAPGRVPDIRLLSDRLRSQPWMSPNWTGALLGGSVEATFEPALEKPRLLAAIFGTLAAIMLGLTAIAICGLASFEIHRRRHEMTVRLAIGATPRTLRVALVSVAIKPVLTGVLAALPLAWMEVRLLSLSVPFVDSNDLRIYASAAAIMGMAALAAAWLPGRRLFTMRAAEMLRAS